MQHSRIVSAILFGGDLFDATILIGARYEVDGSSGHQHIEIVSIDERYVATIKNTVTGNSRVLNFQSHSLFKGKDWELPPKAEARLLEAEEEIVERRADLEKLTERLKSERLEREGRADERQIELENAKFLEEQFSHLERLRDKLRLGEGNDIAGIASSILRIDETRSDAGQKLLDLREAGFVSSLIRRAPTPKQKAWLLRIVEDIMASRPPAVA